MKKRKICSVRRGQDQLLLRNVASGTMLEIIIGRLVWCMLVDLSALSSLSTVFTFITDAKTIVVILPKAVRRELWQARSLLPLFGADLDKPWTSTVLCRD